ncbi:MAG: TolC family protein [Saprospiraceae bacterium]|nr:TolC family protein [Saprospiraceae bacterium]
MLLICFANTARGQNVTTPEAAVSAALQNHPSTKASVYAIKAKKYGEKAALNLPNPEINAESPTGEFYAIGVLQSFDFPTVYARQKSVAKAETRLAQAGQRVTENDLRYTVRTLYLEAQVAEYQSRQWSLRDSLYGAIGIAAARQFAAGEIDFLQKTIAENGAGKVHQERLAAEQKLNVLRQQLASYTGLSNLGTILPLGVDSAGLTALPGISENPSVSYDQQAAQLAEKQINLAKSRALPNFSLGYLNQGPRSTPIDYRFRASIGIPLWAGHYLAGANAAKAESQAAAARVEVQGQAIAFEQARAQSDAATALANVHYYERDALPRSRALIAAATRMRDAGQVDYVTFLRTLDEAYEIQQAYVDQIQALNVAQLRLRYLSGN